MKKKLLSAAALVLLLLIGMVALTACEPKNTHKGIQTVTISTAQKLLEISGNVGTDYDQTTYVLENDIDLAGAVWTPFGTSYENAFCSVFDGNGHTISNVKMEHADVLDGEGLTEIAESSASVGFFGFTKNATVKNLTLAIDYDLGYNTEITYAGGLIGYAYGDTVIQNVTVSGAIDFSLTTDNENMKLYAGGVLGATNGSLVLKDISSSVYLSTGRYMGIDSLYADYEINRLHTAYAGGVAGYIRTIDLSDTNKKDNTLENIVFNGGVVMYADRLNAGGVIGSVYNSSKADNLTTGENVLLIFDSFYRVNAGGIIGYTDNASVTGSQCNAYRFEVTFSKSIEANKIFNVGGLVGYAANKSDISGSTVDTKIILSAETDFAGGLVGVLSDSALSGCTANGRFIMKYVDTGALYDMFGNRLKLMGSGDYMIDTSKPLGDYNKVSLYHWASVAGKLFGAASVSDMDTNFEACYAVVSIKIQSVKAEGKNENGDPLFAYYSSNVDKTTVTFRGDKTIEYLRNPAETFDGVAVLP